MYMECVMIMEPKFILLNIRQWCKKCCKGKSSGNSKTNWSINISERKSCFGQLYRCKWKTKAFCEYFLKNYMNWPEQWAFCNRLNAKYQYEMERWHRSIKHEADGKIVKRLDKSLCLILSAPNTKLVNCVIALERGKGVT